MRARLRVVIDGVPPTVNHVWRVGYRGRVYKTPEAKGFHKAVAWGIRSQMSKHGIARSYHDLVQGEIVRIRMTWYRPDRRKRDSLNIIKVLEDGISDGLGCDDSMFEWETHRGYDAKRPRVELDIATECL